MALLHSQLNSTPSIAPDFSLLWTDNNTYTLAHFTDKKWLCVVFTCNHCPYAVASRPVIIQLAEQFPDIWFAAISSNDANYVAADWYVYMQELSEKLKLPFPYIYDETQEIAKAYNAVCTPDNFLFKNNDWVFELFYQWRLNDNRKDPTKVTSTDMQDHIQQLLAGEKSSSPWTPSMWCSIKRKEHL